MSSVSRTRATNLTGLIDIDALVEANLIRQKTKLNTSTQKLKVEQYKQEQYREIQTKAKKFYNKYFDVLSGDSLFSTKTYNVMKATSNNSDAVTATASIKATAGSYKVTVTNAAKSPSVSISEKDLLALKGQKITINNKEFTLKADATNGKEIAEDLNKQLENAGIKVTAKYTDLYEYGSSDSVNYGGMIIKSDVAGANDELLVVGTGDSIDPVSNNIQGKDAVYSSVKFDPVDINNGHKIKIAEGIEIAVDDKNDLSGIVEKLNSAITSNDDYKGKLEASIEKGDDGKEFIKVTSKKIGTEVDFKVNDAEVDANKITIVKGEAAKKQETEIDLGKFSDGNNNSLIVNGKKIDFKIDSSNPATTIESLNKSLEKAGIKAVAQLDGSDVKLVSTVEGTAGSFTVGYRNNSANVSGFDYKNYAGGDAKVTIEDLTTGVERVYENASNEIEVDGITFKIDENAADSTSTITIKADGTELKDKIVEFINDYNELLGHINGKLYEKYDRSYLPLTDEDKEGLSDSEIEKLEKKAQIGLLRNDSYLSNFADDMKMTMATVMKKEWGAGSATGLSLEKIGINPVKDYSTQNGLFTIDEDKLLAAIEEDIDGIKELFAGKNGIVTKLKDNLSEHATGTFSRLANRAGVADGVTANTNEMTKDIEQRKKLITQMQAMLKEKEDALYVRYSSLESSLASLQAQQSSLSSYFQ